MIENKLNKKLLNHENILLFQHLLFMNIRKRNFYQYSNKLFDLIYSDICEMSIDYDGS